MTPYDMLDVDENVRPTALGENMFYIRHPYTDVYIEPSDNNEDEIVLERINKVASVIALLGGKKMQVLSSNIQLNDHTKSIKGGFEANAPVGNDASTSIGSVGITGEYSQNIVESNNVEVAYEIEWTPGTYTRASYKKAKQLAQQYKLDKDATIANLLVQRDPNTANQAGNLTYKVNVRGDFEAMRITAIDIKTRIEKMGIKFDLNYNDNTSSHTQKQNTFDFKVEFGPLVKSAEEEEADRLDRLGKEAEEKRKKEEEEKQKKLKKIKMSVICVLSAVIITGLIAVFLI
ncbi:MAG: hypothetical protein SPL12_09175 [Bacteroidales bacterium]|nr:hypothetical protein [Bacteroidales bacterium]